MSGPASDLRVDAVPRAGGAWRARVAAAATDAPTPVTPPPALDVRFHLGPRQWVDLDSLVETTLAGLRDAGWYGRGLAGLDALVATRRDADTPRAAVRTTTAAAVARRRPPGEAAVDVRGALPRPVAAEKRAWREAIAAAWGDRAPLAGPVWADVALMTPGALLARLEVVLDALEPVLGRDPRGRDWQEFFPADDRITWLRVRRGAEGVRLRLGSVAGDRDG